ncbi:MAG: radical SAM protein [Candidatus Lokiarchaeota archaeon]|nr:radical SAM protein [Candidatus Lokiarchaeota archaeon]
MGIMSLFNYWRFIGNFFLNKISSILGIDTTIRPLNAQIELTLRCNARCKFCSIWTKAYQKSVTDPEMTTEQVKRIIDGLNKMHITVLSFTGGEPTLRSDLGELIDYAASKGMMTGIATNGYLLEDLVKKGALKNLENCMVSVDFPTAELHDYYRGIKVFDRVVKGMRAARKSGIKVLISTTVTKESLPYMEEMCKFATKNHAMIELLPCENIVREVLDEALEVQNIEKDYIPDLHQWAKEIRRLKQKYPNLTTDALTARIIENGGFGQFARFGLRERFFMWYVTYMPCHVAMAYLFIKYNGDVVFPCKLHPILSVSALKYPIEKIYHAPEVRKIQQQKDTFPFCRGCRLGCAISTSLPFYWSGLYGKYIVAFLKGNFFT